MASEGDRLAGRSRQIRPMFGAFLQAHLKLRLLFQPLDPLQPSLLRPIRFRGAQNDQAVAGVRNEGLPKPSKRPGVAGINKKSAAIAQFRAQPLATYTNGLRD
jgi:hypothetical protein